MINERSVIPAVASARPTGALAYGLGFLAFLSVPIVAVMIAGLVMVAVFPAHKKKGGLAAENARRAANWGLTIVALMVLIAAALGALWLVGRDARGVCPLTVLTVFYVIFAVTHVSVCILGVIKAHRGEVFTNRLAIPFLK